MINPQDLRIGNWIETYIYYSDNFTSKEIAIRVKQLNIEDLKIISEGIAPTYRYVPLSEEWLMRFGFILDNYLVYEKYENNICSSESKVELWSKPCKPKDELVFDISIGEDFGNTTNVCYIKFVHQLQNIYHAIYNKELQLK